MSRKDSQNDDPKPGAAPARGGAELDPPANSTSSPAGEGSLSEKERRLIAEMDDLKNTLIRRQADFENYRKRVEREREQDRHRGIESLVEALLPVLDGFERALAAHGDAPYEEHRKGFELIERQLRDTLAKRGLERIDAEGKAFDPFLHHAVERVVSNEHPDGTILAVLQTGYRFHDRVLRPAMVRVATQPAARAVN
ncbi:MAG TPA: nucleotide exchange factor GrpE [Candidatus Acidoferrales bacterium]|nr:nucleotide exchange factor GrpE [Candidatus Acidoferrales bacterium]